MEGARRSRAKEMVKVSDSYFSASEMSRFKPESIILMPDLLGSSSWVISLAPRIEAGVGGGGKERRKRERVDVPSEKEEKEGRPKSLESTGKSLWEKDSPAPGEV